MLCHQDVIILRIVTMRYSEVSVVAKKNLEGERALQMERQKATLAIENPGAKEMSIKGISNVEEGVKKITGISIASAGQLIVRGLGDRFLTPAAYQGAVKADDIWTSGNWLKQ